MILTDEQLLLASKHLGIAKQKLNETASYLDPKSDRYRFNDVESDKLAELIAVLDEEHSSRRKTAVTS